MTHYLTAFINDTRHSFRDVQRLQYAFNDLESAKAELTSSVLQKKNDGWEIEQGDGADMEKGSATNVILYAITENTENQSTVMYTITTESTPTLDNVAIFPDATDINHVEPGNTKTVSELSTSFIKRLIAVLIYSVNYLNKRPKLSFLILLTVIANILWLNYVNYYSSGIITYIKRQTFEAGISIAVAVVVIFILIKKVNK